MLLHYHFFSNCLAVLDENPGLYVRFGVVVNEVNSYLNLQIFSLAQSSHFVVSESLAFLLMIHSEHHR